MDCQWYWSIVGSNPPFNQTPVEFTASKFLDAKIEAHQTEESYLNQIQAGRDDAHFNKALGSTEYTRQLVPLLVKVRDNTDTLKVLKRQRTLIMNDIDEAIEKRQRTKGPLGEGLLERSHSSHPILKTTQGTRGICLPLDSIRVNR
ncbi:hypothetical protein N7493_007726 [Penicillium malachiteum]|uniref:Uncharacterized protein n=1 Tax=Penicillium malachiteum TaxID=1324776 RepID=A0AAD6HI64_9EURO|nr:hypothetical protein N7493_007726 [Penicillium malachiteum]